MGSQDVTISTTPSSKDVVNSNSTSTNTRQQGRTLLPGAIASAVSLATRSSSLAIKIGSTAGSYGLDAAKFTTVSSLELARGVVAGVLSRAGKDTLARSDSDRAREDAESIIERSLDGIHRAMSQAVFWTTAGFRLTSTTVSMASNVSQLLLSTLDSLFGSTDSSRAIASIVTLIRRELTDPNTGFQGEKVGAVDLVLGICALAYLQGRTWRAIAERERRQEYEEIIWDVVVLDDGERVDVDDDSSDTLFIKPPRKNSVVDTASPRKSPRIRLGDGGEVVECFKEQIAASVPPDSTVSISSSLSTIRTITIDIDAPEPFLIPAIPGAEVIETKLLPSSSTDSLRRGHQATSNSRSYTYRVVYRLQLNQVTDTSITHHGESQSPPIDRAMTPLPAEKLVMSKTSDVTKRDRAEITQKALPAPPPETPGSEGSERSKVPVRKVTPSSTTTTTTTASSSSSSRSPDHQRKGALSSQRRTNNTQNSSHKASSLTADSQGANQKRRRTPSDVSSPREGSAKGSSGSTTTKKPLSKKKETPKNEKPSEKKSGLKQALKGSSQSISNIWQKDSAGNNNNNNSSTNGPSAMTSSVKSSKQRSSQTPSKLPFSRTQARPHSPRLSTPSHGHDISELNGGGSSRKSWIAVHERRRNSITSQTDTFSMHSACGIRPPSVITTTEWLDSIEPPPSVFDGNPNLLTPSTITKGHHKAVPHVPSFYSLGGNDSQNSLVPISYYQKSVYNATDALSTLRRDGTLEGIFPRAHLLRNVARYMLFSSASYGSSFMKLMGISREAPPSVAEETINSDVRHFVHHTQTHTDSILLASFIDPEGGTDWSGSTGRGMPLVHYISLDHEARAVVLACRGTLGFEDILADMACDYDALAWRGKSYRVHKGVHASARRLLHGDDGRVMLTLREALVEFPEYGIILCGHSLGGAVTSLLGVMLSEPNPNGTGFVTAGSLVNDQGQPLDERYCLPRGRPVHVYAYGPPGTMSPSLRKRTRGLITSIVHGNDVVPYLSLGVLHDFQTVALAFRNDQHQAMQEIRQRLWQSLQTGITDKWYRDVSKSPGEDDMEWALSILQTLRSNMGNKKLVPPGEIFTVENRRVLRRDAFVPLDEEAMGKPAQRVVLKYVKDVEARFKEVRFGVSMLMDHSPANYEEALNKLRIGVDD